MTDDRGDVPGPTIPRVSIYLSHEDFNDPSLLDYLVLTHANAVAPLARVQHEVVFRLEPKLEPGEALVLTDPIYGMGPKLSKKHTESVCSLISARRSADAVKANPEAARLLDRMRQLGGGS